MKRTWVYDDKGNSREVTPEPAKELHYVQGDIPEFLSPDGKHISGRTDWREHLARTDSVEMGHADLKAQKAAFEKKKSAFSARLNRKVDGVGPAESPALTEQNEYRMSRLHAEVANRLEGRPQPDRTTLIKLTLEQARSLRK